jgi:CDP-diacylglycerol--glycerol-3-phosphate 3-phosphatidyltransferase
VTWNLPNSLTLARLLCVPLLAILLVVDDPVARDAAAIVFIAAAITDFLDGAIARKRGITSAFGALADPIADKALITVALVGLSLVGELPWWITVVILIREFGVTIVRLVVLRHGVIPASRGGKVKTVAQIVAISMYLAVAPPAIAEVWSTIAYIAMIIAVLLTVATGIDYVRRAVVLRRDRQTALRRRRLTWHRRWSKAFCSVRGPLPRGSH